MGKSRPLFCLFSFFSRYIFKTNWKSIDGVLGIRTQSRRMVGTDETTERVLWFVYFKVVKRIIKILCLQYSISQRELTSSLGQRLAEWNRHHCIKEKEAENGPKIFFKQKLVKIEKKLIFKNKLQFVVPSFEVWLFPFAGRIIQLILFPFCKDFLPSFPHSRQREYSVPSTPLPTPPSQIQWHLFRVILLFCFYPVCRRFFFLPFFIEGWFKLTLF